MRDYEIFSGDVLVATWFRGKLEVLCEKLLPLYLKRVKNADMWLETRAIDSHRANSRLLKKALRLEERDDISTAIYSNGATLTDNYWIREKGSNLTFEDVKFTDDYFSNLALIGSYDSFNRCANSKNTKTPELTNIGSFEKCWKLKNGTWQMLKRANHNELFSELFVYNLGVRLGMNMAKYERGEGVIKTWNFVVEGVNFEPASSFLGDNEDYFEVVKALNNLCPNAVPDYIKMIFLDTVCLNPDRHTNNFGLLRDSKTGELLGLAPNFDNNMALISRGYPKNPKSSDILITLFNDLMKSYPEFKKYIPKLEREDLTSVLQKLNMKVKSNVIIDLIMSRYGLIEK